ncbi:hypothetical protein F7R01_10310 [Pseudomonas argentinensis]|uniref:RIP homotypic interaction motif-containing protein n=1 Tax=Phytopseudomonas argentinensis TaxID=289370 RepID=A0A1I3I6R8_9GAMM|nr:RIP homotypic interaction motif-containing protein [Pseudomonas argentinensis]KAB0547884.1 hypothetical protein F7R01_10310 [Pseudomonas argentinensis]SFI43688.1 RIP homotypic interaction motif-containing protein [Pseudomonas argentinensis]
MNFTDDLYNDTVYIRKTDGSVVGPYKTSVGKLTPIFDSALVVSEGDELIRDLPNGRQEVHTIVDVDFFSGMPGMDPCFNLHLRKPGAANQTSVQTNHITINNSSGIQVGNDNVMNIQNAFNDLIQRIDNSNGTLEDKQEAKSRIASLLKHPLVAAVLGGVTGGIF